VANFSYGQKELNFSQMRQEFAAFSNAARICRFFLAGRCLLLNAKCWCLERWDFVGIQNNGCTFTQRAALYLICSRQLFNVNLAHLLL
jgi:hypothetical protein